MVGKNTLRLCYEVEEEYKEWRIEGEPQMQIKATSLDSAFTTAKSLSRILKTECAV